MLCFVALAAAGAACGRRRPRPASPRAIHPILQKHDVAGSDTGVYMWDFDAARQVLASHADTRLAPGLQHEARHHRRRPSSSWGPEHRFKTELYGPDVPVYGGVLYGDVYLKGYGDPSLSTLVYQRTVLHLTTASFESFAKRLRTLKVAQGQGPRAGRRELVRQAAYRPVLEAGPAARDAGRCRRFRATRASTTASASRTRPPTRPGSSHEALRAKGIKVTGKPGAGKVPETARLLKQQFSAPLRALLKRMNKESDNFFAEILVKGLGKDFYEEGSTRGRPRSVARHPARPSALIRLRTACSTAPA